MVASRAHTGSHNQRASGEAAVPLTLKPMEAESVDALPEGSGWHFEPKHDGFRCVAFRDGSDVQLMSRNQKPLKRYFPELVEGLPVVPPDRFVIDGEIIIPGQTFEALQLRLHPAASRIDRLAAEHPASLVAFDLLVDSMGHALLRRPFSERRAALESLVKEMGRTAAVRLSRATRSVGTARKWLGEPGLDGIMAKRLDLPYLPGERAMQKYKLWKTVDCVVAGLYRKEGTRLVESLLLGLYDEDGKLNYIGRVPVHTGAAELGEALEPLTGRGGFTGRAPGGRSRWSGRARTPVTLEPVLVAEVSADHISEDRMRHAARLLRWRDDKPPEACTMDQLH